MMHQHGKYIDREDLRRLSVLSPHKAVLAMFADWFWIVAAICVSQWSESWAVYVASVVVIAGRMHALGAIVHDAAHYRFIENKRLGEWIGDVFAAWPILITVDGYRTTHLDHHLHTNTDADPDFAAREGTAPFTFPVSVKKLALHLTGYLFTWRSLVDIVAYHTRKIVRSAGWAYAITRVCFYLGVVAAAWATGALSGLFFYWVVPFSTVFFALMYVRAVAEHFGDLDYSTLESGTRTVIPHIWERPFFSPHNLNLHTEHHLFPSVPFYNLPELHAILMAHPDYRARAHITRGYTTGLLAECLGSIRGRVRPTTPAVANRS